MKLPASLEHVLQEYDQVRGNSPTVGSGDRIRHWVMKQYRAGVREFGIESWQGPVVYEVNGETYVCRYKVFNPHKLVSDLQFQVSYGLLRNEYSRLTTTRGNARG